MCRKPAFVCVRVCVSECVFPHLVLFRSGCGAVCVQALRCGVWDAVCAPDGVDRKVTIEVGIILQASSPSALGAYDGLEAVQRNLSPKFLSVCRIRTTCKGDTFSVPCCHAEEASFAVVCLDRFSIVRAVAGESSLRDCWQRHGGCYGYIRVDETRR